MLREFEINQAITAPVIQNRTADLQFDMNNDFLLYKIGGEIFNFTNQ
jgi:hypothetical protein